jgi:protein-S-isoprenylcysteine O-methyltransferase Ste14
VLALTALLALRLWVYAGMVVTAFQLRVVYGEEPWLARRHGEAWTAYHARVPRWFPWPGKTGAR